MAPAFVAPDLRGYGDSGKPETDAAHTPYSKREMARDQAEVMSALGIDTFAVVGHDRGARVGHRLARDHRERVSKLCTLDICPTLDMYETTDMAFAAAYYHWFFLIQPADYPERMIGQDPAFYLSKKLKFLADGTAITPEAMAEYQRCFAMPGTIHASCEDYRAKRGLSAASTSRFPSGSVIRPVWSPGAPCLRGTISRRRFLTG